MDCVDYMQIAHSNIYDESCQGWTEPCEIVKADIDDMTIDDLCTDIQGHLVDNGDDYEGLIWPTRLQRRRSDK